MWQRQRLRDKFSGLVFPHEYTVIGLDTPIDESLVWQQVNNSSRKKFLYLKTKFFDTVGKDKNPVLIRLENEMTDSEAYHRLEYLVKIFGKLNPKIRFILASQSFEKNVQIMPNAIFVRLKKRQPDQQNEGNWWHSSQSSWNKLFKLSRRCFCNANIKTIQNIFKSIS
jgi:hypothetical protein